MRNEQDLRSAMQASGFKELKLVQFFVGDSAYGVAIDQVREIINADLSVVAVPDALPAIDGAINLRGKIIPLINLATFFSITIERVQRIIITEFSNIFFAFGVTAVAKLYTIPVEEIEQPAEVLQTKEGYVLGIVKIEGHVVYILDLEKVAKSLTT